MATFKAARDLLVGQADVVFTDEPKRTAARGFLDNAGDQELRCDAMQEVSRQIAEAAGHKDEFDDLDWPDVPVDGSDADLDKAVEETAQFVIDHKALFEPKKKDPAPGATSTPVSAISIFELKALAADLQEDFPDNRRGKLLTAQYIDALKDQSAVDSMITKVECELRRERAEEANQPNRPGANQEGSKQGWIEYLGSFKIGSIIKATILGCGGCLTMIVLLVVLLVGGRFAINWYNSEPTVEVEEDFTETPESTATVTEEEAVDTNKTLLQQIEHMKSLQRR